MKVIYEHDPRGVYRINRGGCWASLACLCRAADRDWGSARWRICYLGFLPVIRIRGLG